MKSPRVLAVLSCLVVAVCWAEHTSDDEVRAARAVIELLSRGPAIPTAEEVKKPFPLGENWKEVEFRGRKMLFHLYHRPSWGESYSDLLGWRFEEHRRGWVQVVCIKTHNVGYAVDWDVDIEAGTLSLRGLSNNELKNVECIRIDLRAL
jgi:hypothetical protein